MKIWRRCAAILAALFLLTGSFPVSAEDAGRMPEEPAAEQEDTEAPAFEARLEFWSGYTVVGTFTDFTPDITCIDTLYSLDEEHWQTVQNGSWHLFDPGDSESALQQLQRQPCLFGAYEPLKSYLAEEIDRFYLKLRITREDGLSYDTQSTVIERGGPRPIPEGAGLGAWFSSEISVTEAAPGTPDGYIGYGRYQITVSADAAAEEILALLPDTLPVEIRFKDEQDRLAIGAVDCPVCWKPLSLPPLNPGGSVTIPDAAEAVLVPAGTLVSTPLGVFELTEPLSLDTPPTTDEIRLVLNVSQEDKSPAGVLREGKNGLEVAFRHKPTGAASIRAYVLTEGEESWTELSGLSLLEELNQPSTANSGYAQILQNDQEPYRSYLASVDAGETPVPFFIGLEIEGGIYDGRQLLLAWPDIYEQLPDLPKLVGVGGNEGNAGADNQSDSTEDGQRPDLPWTPEEQQDPAPDEDPGQHPVPDTETGSDQQEPGPDAESGFGGQDSGWNAEAGSGEQDPGRNVEAGSVGQNPRQNAETGSGQQESKQNTDFNSGQQDSGQNTEAGSEQLSIEQNTAFGGYPRPAAPDSGSDRLQKEAQADPEQEERAADPADSQILAPLVAQAAADVKKEDDVLALSGGNTAAESAAKPDRRIPLLSLTAVFAGAAVGEVIRRKTGYCLFCRLAAHIRNILHK